MSRLFDISASPGEFLSRYSSILRNFVSDADVVRDLAAATAFNVAQVLDLADEAKQSIGVHELVDRRKLYVVPIRIRESELQSDLNVFTYGSGAVYGDGHVYGGVNTASVSFGVPQGIASIGLLSDSFIEETVVFFPGSDFVLNAGVLTLWRNPFDTLPSHDVYDAAGAKLDREIVLWATNVEVWDRLAESMYGLIAGVVDRGESGYAEVVGAVWDAIVAGPSTAAIYSVLCATAGIRLAAKDEVVRSIEITSTRRIVVTDTETYEGHLDAGVLVGVGDTLHAGAPVFDTVLLRDLARPDSDLDGIPALTFTVLSATGAVVVGFPNHDVAVRSTPEGVTFDVAGSPDAVAAFWASVRQQEAATGTTLAQMLVYEFGDIPLTLNPLRYLTSHMFLANTVVVTLRPQCFLRESGLLVRAGAMLTRLIPARILLVQHSYLDDPLDSIGVDTTFDGVGFIEAESAIDRGRPAGAASPATELAYSDLQPMLANYAR